MTSSLVGSEMCIRDRFWASATGFITHFFLSIAYAEAVLPRDGNRLWLAAVSYTHLTLPTICSV
eukprot:10218107-Prorocentrum_lima.AAC.1